MTRIDDHFEVSNATQDRRYSAQHLIDVLDQVGTDNAIHLADYATADGQKQSGGEVAISTPSTVSNLTGLTLADIGKLIVVDGGEVWTTGTGRITNGASVLYKSEATLTLTATGGTYTITFSGQTTSAIPYNASAGTIQTALVALSTINASGATVTGTGPYVIKLTANASSGDISLLTTTATSLTTDTNGPIAAAALSKNAWGYADEGLRVHVQGAGAAGGVLVAWLGSFDTIASTTANLVDANGDPVTASATVTGTYRVLNWTRRTILDVPSSTSLTLSAPIDAAITANLAGVQVIYGTDEQGEIQNAVDTAIAAGQPLDLGTGIYTSGGHIDANLTTTGISIYGKSRFASQIWMLVTDSIADSGRLGILGSSDTSRAVGVSLRNFTLHVPCANTRGAGTLSLGPSSKTGAQGIFLSKISHFEVVGVTSDRCYGAAFLFQNSDTGIIDHCYSYRSGSNGFDVNNANSSGYAITPSCYDITFTANHVEQCGDDFYAADRYAAMGPLHQRINFFGCTGNSHRQIALGRGMNFSGCEHSNCSGLNVKNTNGEAVDIAAAKATNAAHGTITTPGTGAVVTFSSPPKNMTVGVTQMRLFNGDSDTTWVGDVTGISGGGEIITLTAATTHDSVETCPFTGADYLCQWGANNSGFRFGVGGARHLNISNVVSENNNRNTAGDGPTNGGIRLTGGNASTERVEHITIDGVDLDHCEMAGILTDAFGWGLSVSNMSDARQAVRYVTIQNYRVNGTGFSPITSLRPWPGIYIKAGSDITLKNGQILDTDDQLCLIANTHVGGLITIDDLKGFDIGRSYTTGAPLTKAFDAGNGSGHTTDFRNIQLFAPTGTASGTQYVYTAAGVPAPPAANYLDLVCGPDPQVTYAAAAVVVNTIYWVRMRNTGDASNLHFVTTAAAGNVITGVYADNGTGGRNSRPSGSALVSTASQAVATGTNTVALGETVSFTHLDYWAAVMFDNTGTTLHRLSTTSATQSGFCHSQVAAGFAMEAPSSPGASAFIPFIFFD